MTLPNYKKLMKKCIAIAKKSEGHVSPNPLVGAIVLDKNGEIAGFGRHEKFKEAHAEVNALKIAGEKARGGIIIVNLEPCSHFGKNPPCADLIIEKGLKKVVIGMEDPNPLVGGNGIKKCQDAGIEVIQGVLEGECRELNEIFIKNHIKKLPFIAIKTASTADGRIAARTGDSKWITNEKSRKHVHKLRNKYDAVLTGSGTIKADNPSLTARYNKGRSPARIIIDSNLTVSPNAKVFNNDGSRVFLAVNENIEEDKIKCFPPHINFIKCPPVNNKIDLVFLSKALFEEGIYSIMIEGGPELNGAFLKSSLVDKIYHFSAPKILGDQEGKSWVSGFETDKIEDSVKMKLTNIKTFDDDILSTYRLYDI